MFVAPGSLGHPFPARACAELRLRLRCQEWKSRRVVKLYAASQYKSFDIAGARYTNTNEAARGQRARLERQNARTSVWTRERQGGQVRQDRRLIAGFLNCAALAKM